MYGAGYGASSRCYEEAGETLGMTPTQFKAGGVNQTIRFAVAKCQLGWVAIAATERGICSIDLAMIPRFCATSWPIAFTRPNYRRMILRFSTGPKW
jgi:AraC family transcriptional regulator of adaptative response/methylated-DNA-[protein]-cysteine methyltransferase